MLFNNPFQEIRCENCNNEHDAFASKCPKCGHISAQRGGIIPFEDHKVVGPLRELALFLTGWLGLQLITLVVYRATVLFGIQGSKEFMNMLINYSVYGVLAVLVVAIAFPKIKSLFSKFFTLQTFWGVLIFLFVLLFDNTYSSIINKLGATTNDNQVVIEMLISNWPIQSLIFTGLVGPFVEEMTYRVGLFSFLKRINRYFAYLVVALFFGLVHMHDLTSVNEWMSLPPYIFAGFAFTFAYDKWGLHVSLSAHVIINTLAVVSRF